MKLFLESYIELALGLTLDYYHTIVHIRQDFLVFTPCWHVTPPPLPSPYQSHKALNPQNNQRRGLEKFKYLCHSNPNSKHKKVRHLFTNVSQTNIIIVR